MYLNKLKEKGIKVVPLEEYINTKTKILHRCSCGNEWKTIPNRVLNGVKCGCELNPSKSNEWYLNKLKEKGIKVVPLEEYIKSKVKILHKCICGNEWNVNPNNILNMGQLCGCTKRESYRDSTFYKNKKTVLYYVKLILEDKILYKIGVTLFKNSVENSINARFGKELNFIEIQETKIYDDGSEAFNIEQKIINRNWKLKYNGEKVLKSGNTELFTEDIKYDFR